MAELLRSGEIIVGYGGIMPSSSGNNMRSGRNTRRNGGNTTLHPPSASAEAAHSVTQGRFSLKNV